MNKKYVNIDKEMIEAYFVALTQIGTKGIVVPHDKIYSQNLIFAKKHGMKVWVKFRNREKFSVSSISYDLMGVTFNDSTLKCFSLEKLKSYVSTLSDADLSMIDGFIVDYPRVCELIWSESFKNDFYNEYSNYIEDYLYILFETSVECDSFRYWYMNKCEDYLLDNYVMPAADWAKTKNLKLCFDLGVDRCMFYYLLNHIPIFKLLEQNIPVMIKHDIKSSCEVVHLLSEYGGDSVVLTEKIKRNLVNLNLNIISPHCEIEPSFSDSKESVLLIRSDRGTYERFVSVVHNGVIDDDNKAATASVETAYYTDMLLEKGFNFVSTNEELFAKYTRLADGVLRYKDTIITQILFSEKCIFSDKAIQILKEIQKNNICINNTYLIKILKAKLL